MVLAIACSPLMSVLPFLLLGIGVDDMFVIVNSYDNTPAHLPVPERVALALAESGSSVTVTSLTDVLAFFIGSFTSLPALRSRTAKLPCVTCHAFNSCASILTSYATLQKLLPLRCVCHHV